MSTQSPQPLTPRGPRNNRRSQKKNTTPQVPKTAMLSTPPTSPPRHMSPAGVATDPSNNVQPKKKPPRSGKKPNQGAGNRASPAPNGHRHTSSQPNNGTPMKDNAAYAGPTFHASPAPSALPIPSFFSKSFPESDLAPTLETDSEDAETEQDLDVTPSKPRARPPPPQPSQATANGSEPSPLDFLFKAAVQARNSNAMHSPEPAARMRSPQTDSKVPYPKPHTAPGDVFAFEMGSPHQARPRIDPGFAPSYQARPRIDPGFAPSYQDRMDAFRSSNSPSQSSNAMDHERRAKNEELKRMLLNPPPQKPPGSISPPAPSQNGPYAPRPNINSNVPHYATPTRTHSGPSVPLSHGFQGQQQPVLNGAGRPPVSYSYANFEQYRNSGSPLSREVPSNANPSTRSSPSPYGYHLPNAHVPMPQPNFASPQPQYGTASFAMPTKSPSPSRTMDASTNQMADTLKRMLNISAAPSPGSASGIPPAGYHRSFAA